MRRGLSLSQRLTGPDGLPTGVARGGAVVLALAVAAVGYAAGPDSGESPAPARPAVAASRLAGDLPIAAPVARPSLRAVSALPALREQRARRRSGGQPEPVTAPVMTVTPQPTPDASPAPSATPQPAAPVPVLQAPAPPSSPTPRPAPTPQSSPAPTFDSSG